MAEDTELLWAVVPELTNQSQDEQEIVGRASLHAQHLISQIHAISG